MNRRTFLTWAASGLLLRSSLAYAGRKPPYAIVLPAYMDGRISERDIVYLNETIPQLFNAHADLFPALEAPPQYVVIDTIDDTLTHYGDVRIAANILGDDALTLREVQYLLVTMRFGSVATPHRNTDLDQFGRVVYLKQYPRLGYRTPYGLLLEEMLHAQQDQTVMRHIIEADGLDVRTCLHGPLKGLSELGAHLVIDPLYDATDYVFVLDDGEHCENAAHAAERLAERLGSTPDILGDALLHDVAAYTTLDSIAMNFYGVHLWQMVSTWRPSRDENGDIVTIAPAFLTDDTEAP